jgi:hypothetical protein
MTRGDLDAVAWLSPWTAVTSREPLEAELRLEVGEAHPLFGLQAEAIVRRGDCDDVLFFVTGRHPRLAVVHLTWSARAEEDPRWPRTRFINDLTTFVAEMVAEHAEADPV